MKKKILLAEDETELAKALGTILKYSDYDVTIVHNGLEAVEQTKKENYDAIILDVMMPIMTGIEAIKEIRHNGIDTPTIFLTAKSEIDDKVEGLDAGANDYLTKPFDKKELLARLRALTREKENREAKLKVGNLIFDKENSEISNQVSTFHLNHKESEIMEILVKNQERSVSKDEIFKRVWEDENTEEAVNMYISYLQQKFIALDANVTINHKNGYILESK